MENLMRQLSAIIKRKTMTLILSLSCAYKVAHTLGHGLIGEHLAPILYSVPLQRGKIYEVAFGEKD